MRSDGIKMELNHLMIFTYSADDLRPLMTQLYRAIHSYTGLYTAIHSFIGLYTAIHGYTQLYRDTHSYKEL